MNVQSRTSRSTFPSQIRNEEVTPLQIRHLKDLNLVTVIGSSNATYTVEKYVQLLMSIENHLDNSNSLNLHFKYDSLNSLSLKYISAIVKILNKESKLGKAIKISWSCVSGNELEMLKIGHDLKEACAFEFEITYT